MGIPVGELQKRISSREFHEWMAYEKVSGTLGPERGDLHTAMILTLLYNMWRGKNDKAKKIVDFLPEWDKKPQTAEDQFAMVQMLTKAFGGQVAKDGD